MSLIHGSLAGLPRLAALVLLDGVVRQAHPLLVHLALHHDRLGDAVPEDGGGWRNRFTILRVRTRSDDVSEEEDAPPLLSEPLPLAPAHLL